jgi:RNA polymerase sigma-70 factor (ECF subfamily)
VVLKHRCATVRRAERGSWHETDAVVAGGALQHGPAAEWRPHAAAVDRSGDVLKDVKSPGGIAARRSIRPDREVGTDADGIDRALMARIVARDQHAFALLAERHASAALGLAQRIVRSTADAEDVVQESLTRLWIFADRWNPSGARFSSWFYRIVTNQAISRLRRKTSEPLEGIDEPSDETPSPHDQVAGREIGQAISTAVGRLPPRQRAAIALCYDQGLSCAEAAEAMGVSIGTMESLLFRARRSLREWLGSLNGELEER